MDGKIITPKQNTHFIISCVFSLTSATIYIVELPMPYILIAYSLHKLKFLKLARLFF